MVASYSCWTSLLTKAEQALNWVQQVEQEAEAAKKEVHAVLESIRPLILTESRVIQVNGSPTDLSQKLTWPRCAADDPSIQLGIDVKAKQKDIIRIVHKYFKVRDISMEELLQEVYLAILHKNYTRSAHDPRKSSFGHYVFMVANNVCINLVHRKCRYDKERDSIDIPQNSDDHRTLLDTIDIAAPEETDTFNENLEEIETIMRQRGMWDLARYVRAVRSGANPDIIREALTWGGKKVSNKTIRDIRAQVREIVEEIHIS